MPFTFAHPAAVLPLRSLRVVPIVFSALVIGSMAPDIVYFAPLSLDGDFTHSLAGLFLFCLPAGMLMYLLIMHGLRRPLSALLPFGIARRLTPAAAAHGMTPLRRALAILLSLLLGAMTHVLWDALTHDDTVVTLQGEFWRWLTGDPVLQFAVYPVAQHVSSIAGIALLCMALRTWIRSTPPDPGYREPVSPGLRRLAWAAMVGVASVAALLAWRNGAAEPLSLRSFHAVVAPIRWLAMSALAWCATWHFATLGFLRADADPRR